MEPSGVVSDERLVQAVNDLLANADLAQTTTKKVIAQLEEKLGIDVACRKPVIKQAIASFAANVAQQAQQHEGEQLQTTQEDSTSDVEKENGKQTEQQQTDAKDSGGESDDGEQEGGDDEDEEGEEEEEEEEESTSSARKRKRGNGGFNAELQLSTELSEFMNSITSTRTEVVKAMWDYIKTHSLQDPADRRKIRCDDTLQRIFKRKTLTMFNMNKFLTQHMKAVHELSDAKVDVDIEQRPRAVKAAKAEGTAKRAKKESTSTANSGFNKPLELSDQLGDLLGERVLSRPQVVKHMWKYIKENSLQDPNDGRNIICDDKLRDMFGVSKFTAFSMNKLLKKHVGV